jgi:hypothetical protein
MVESWATYSEFRQQYYSNEHGFQLPTEALDPKTIEQISFRQADNMELMIEAFEGFVDEYGLEMTTEVIDTFGIYNFSRHNPAKLAEQLSQWKAGARVETVVAEARSDWNSYNGGKTAFDPEVGTGVFYFEAGSGKAAARIAVQVGRHEREQGRDPDVKRFILHAHANEELLVMGPNRATDSISLEGYLAAARGAKKINTREVNDFRRHLGPNFEVILQGCSTAAEPLFGKNITETMHERHDTKVSGATLTISTAKIRADGTVEFTSGSDSVPTKTYQ